MSFLKSLKFIALNETEPSPLEKKRSQMVANLRDQLILLENPHHSRTRKKSVKIDGEKHVQEKQVPVRPWWRGAPDGQVAFFVRSGLKKIEFEKGMTAILLPSINELPALIEGLIKAVGDGELDHLIAPKEGQKVPTRKKAA
jgi:hypothetical protein